MTELRIIIAGGGLAGLTLAHHLHRQGVGATVYERRPTLIADDPGYRLHINSTGTTALHAALEPQLWELFLATSGSPDDDMLLFDDQLNPGPARDRHAAAGTGTHTADIPEHMVMCRSTLRRILHVGLEDRVHFGISVLDYHTNPDDTVTVDLDNGDTAEADVLIAADGVNSAIRARRLPHVRVVDLGSRHIAAKIPLTPETRARLPKQMFNTFSLAFNTEHDGLTFGPLERTNPRSPLVAQRDRDFQVEVRQNYALSIFNSLTHRMIPDAELFAAAPAELKAYVLDRVASWHPTLVESVRLWDTDTVRPLALRSCVPTGAWAPSNVTVMGDAIHAMSSALGIGANTALRDAHVLGGELVSVIRGEKALLPAIGEYESAMREYGFDAVRRSAAVGTRVIGHRPLPS